MTTCIYCRANAQGSVGRAHVVPEALGQNEFVLPLGLVCDACNHYLGHELDSVLVAHPIVSAAIQTLRLPGKEGRLRQRIGNVDRTVAEGAITIPCTKPVRHADGTISAQPLISRSFDFNRFRRSLHHIGLNLVAYQEGHAAALSHNFDAVRAYVRRPKLGEVWPIAQHISFAMKPEITLGIHEVSGTCVVGMNLLSCSFFIGLDGRGRATKALRTLADEEQAIDYVGMEFQPARAPKQGRERYRMTIYVDDVEDPET